jgi:hypothetical protein
VVGKEVASGSVGLEQDSNNVTNAELAPIASPPMVICVRNSFLVIAIASLSLC